MRRRRTSWLLALVGVPLLCASGCVERLGLCNVLVDYVPFKSKFETEQGTLRFSHIGGLLNHSEGGDCFTLANLSFRESANCELSLQSSAQSATADGHLRLVFGDLVAGPECKTIPEALRGGYGSIDLIEPFVEFHGPLPPAEDPVVCHERGFTLHLEGSMDGFNVNPPTLSPVLDFVPSTLYIDVPFHAVQSPSACPVGQ